MSSPVEQIKSRLNVVDVVQSYVKLQKAGANFRGLCPFHAEKTPSFFVSPARETWHCFGCNRGGDIFSFVMEIEGVEFLDALKVLAGRAGVELKPIDPKYRSERDRLLRLMEEAKNFYENELKKNKEVLNYLKERGLTDETIKNFNIGFAPSVNAGGWRNLFDFLNGRGYSENEVEKSGMSVRPQKGGRPYDRFRSRIMFPLANGAGQIVGFSGRIFGEDSEMGKYINTPQTILYDKSKLLYAFDKAKSEIRKNDKCILVEGQMDVIMSHQAGFANTVAVSGTALTNEHLNVIKRLTDNLILAFDNDEAGLGAAGRGIDLALEQGFEVKIAAAPFGKDPADAIKENPDEWKKAVDNAKHIIDFFLNSLKDRKKAEKIILPYIAVMPSEMEKAHWVSKLAKHLGINEKSVWDELKKIKSAGKESPVKSGGESQIKYQPVSRTIFLKQRFAGLILWLKNSEDADVKDAVKRIVKKRNLDLDKLEKNKDARKFIFEAELYFSGSEDLKGELEKLDFELEKEEIREELSETASRIKKLEAVGDEDGLKECLNNFNKLTKKLNEFHHE